jgi:glycosyltransferase involved in cell wall biosynthesis
MSVVRRLLTIGHSYCVRRNRELAEAIGAAGRGEWEVTVLAPDAFPGDLGPIETRRDADERCSLLTVPVHAARWIHVMRYGRGLRDALRQSWDVVHCWEEPYIVSGAQVARACQPTPALVYASFQNIAKRYPPPFAAFERSSLRRATGWIAFGHTVEDVLIRRAEYAARPHAVIPFGVDTTRFSADITRGALTRGSLRWGDETPVIGCVGRFIDAKGIPMLLRALAELDRRGTSWRALFVGGGPLEGALRAFAGEHGDRVRVVTGIDHDRIPGYLNAMDLLCAPSQTTGRWREQFGRMIIEALACGVPVVGSDSGEISHVIGDGGVVFGERDETGLVRALETLLTDAGARTRLGTCGRRRAESEFAWPVIGGQHLAFFNRLLEE